MSDIEAKKGPFEEYLTSVLPEFDRVGADIVTRWRKGRFYKPSVLQEDISVYESLLTGGKKLRSAIGLLGFESARGESQHREGVLRALISYEIVHNSFLIHDDIQDHSLERRGKPSIHEQYRINHEASGGRIDHRQYGIATAINTGSLGVFRALGIIWDIDNQPDRIVAAQQWLRYIIEVTLQGQRLDLADIKLDQLTPQYVYQVYHQKTAVYTLAGPLILGAILAGASKEHLGLLNTYGVNLGITYQIIDDHLGLFGEESVIGKPIDTDVKEGKKTLHFVEAYRRANPQQQEFLRHAWGNNELSDTDLLKVRETIAQLGVREFALDRAIELAHKARLVTPRISQNSTIRGFFEDLTLYIINRDF